VEFGFAAVPVKATAVVICTLGELGCVNNTVRRWSDSTPG